MKTSIGRSVALVLVAAIPAGCASYATPGRGADMRVFSPELAPPSKARTLADAANGPPVSEPASPIDAAFAKQPMARFPASVAVVRVQAPNYRSQTNQGWGSGRYSIVTTRDVEREADVKMLSELPNVAGVAPINRLLIDGSRLDTDEPLRQAAAALHADILVIYTIDSAFTTEDKAVPLSVISLGLSPNKQVRLTSTASAILVDTRSGYVYGVAEATCQKKSLTNAWSNKEATDRTRRQSETEAFAKLVVELKTTWSLVTAIHAATRPAS